MHINQSLYILQSQDWLSILVPCVWSEWCRSWRWITILRQLAMWNNIDQDQTVMTSYNHLISWHPSIVTSLASLSVCLWTTLLKSYERIGMKFYGRVLSSTRKNWLNFGGDLGIVRWVNEQKYTVIVVAYPDRGEGNDPEPFFFFFFFFFFSGWVVFRNQGSTFLQWAIWE